MSVTEILVLVGGLALGYWVVSKLYDDLYRDRRTPTPQQGADQNAADAGGKPAAPDGARDKQRVTKNEEGS